MKPEQQRIAIAQVCGWNPSPVSRGKWCHDSNMSMAKNGAYSVWVGRGSLPDYLNDLNAMHEAEKVILNYDAGSHGRYIDHLIDVCGKRKDETWHLAIFHATASQRAEAFLRTLNLWTS